MFLLKKIRESYASRIISVSLSIQLIIPTWQQRCFALGDGPTTPESTGFSSLQPEEQVDLYTGDFKYSIPLLTVGTYPIGLNYNSNVTMEQEASWVGLGWNLNMGVVDRQMRGLPDDFKYDMITQEDNTKPNITCMLGLGKSMEFVGFKTDSTKIPKWLRKKIGKLSKGKNLTLGYNNYTGMSINFSQSKTLNYSLLASKNTAYSAKLGLGYSIGTGGLSISPEMGIEGDDSKKKDIEKGYLGFGFNVNSMTGIQGTHFGGNYKRFSYSSSYSPITFIPGSKLSYKNYSGALTIKVTGEGFWLAKGMSISGNFSQQKISQKTKSVPAVGFLYMDNSISDKNYLADVNREKDLPYMPGLPAMQQTYLEPDIFNVNAEGLGGSYRAYKNSGVIVSDNAMTASKGTDMKLDIEYAAGNIFKGALNPTVGPSYSQTGTWLSKNDLSGSNLPQQNIMENGFSNCYFKRAGETGTGISDNYYNNSIYGEHAVAFQLDKGGNQRFNYKLKTDAYFENGNVTSAGDNLIKSLKYSSLPVQSTAFQPLVYDVLQHHPLYQKLYGKYINPAIVRGNHIVNIQVAGQGGSRYVFGCPAYNTLQKEVSFNVNNGTGSQSQHLVTYDPAAGDNSINNKAGLSHYFHSQSLPPYPYSYNLTEIYSDNYSDLTGDGPTLDDYGDYTLFSYKKAIAQYKWRAPMTSNTNTALYNENAFSLDDDNTGTYSYGTKDIWYPDTVKSKNEIAIFYTSARNDGKEAASENGGIGSRSLNKLDSILLFNLHDYNNKGMNGNPLKRIIFKYDYSLCKGTPDNNIGHSNGKLTLREVLILDGSSYENQRQRFVLNYSSVNPNYDYAKVDRWGNYKSATGAALTNAIYPYAEQNSAAANSNSAAWRLEKIDLPSGGTIKVEYESDSYRYVQDKKAMRMFTLLGVTSSAPSSSSFFPNSELYSGNTTKPYLVFETDIPSPFSQTQAEQEYAKYFEENVNEHLYFKAKVNVNLSNSANYSAPAYDYVFGFAEVESKGVFYDNNKWYGWLKVKDVQHKNKNFHPVSMAAMQYSMYQVPRFYQDQQMISDNTVMGVVMAFMGEVLASPVKIINSVLALLRGPFKYMRDNDVGKTINASESWIRLCVRNEKYGGGSRVKKITYSNNWGTAMQQGENGNIQYIKKYKYMDENGNCSGVAAYEPMTGGDEIPQHLALTYKNQTSVPKLLAWTRNLSSSEQHLYYLPIGEMQYPAPVVGYSRVVEETEVPSPYQNNGRTEYSFFTAKDFPVRVLFTGKTEHTPKRDIFGFFINTSRQDAVVTQGFSIILNDMAGKEKMVKTFDGEGNLLKKASNHYSLGEKRNYLQSSNTVQAAYPGLESDVAVDLREEYSTSASEQFQLNLDISSTGVITAPLPSAWPVQNISEATFRSAVVTKVIEQHGVLEKQEITDRGADVSVRNLLSDPVTGNVLVSAVKGRFGKETYHYQLPAYFVYANMGASSQNAAYFTYATTDATGKISSGTTHFTDGDMLMDMQNNRFLWVLQNGASKYLIAQNGNTVINLNAPVYVYSSGYRNKLNDITETAEVKNNPVTGNQIVLSSNKGIIDAQAKTFIDYYSYPCDTCMLNCTAQSSWGKDTVLVLPVNDTIHLNFEVVDGCDCNASVFVSASQQYESPASIEFHWQNVYPPAIIHDTAYALFPNRYSSTHVQNLCPGTYILEVKDNTSGQSWVFTFPIGNYNLNSNALPVVNPFLHHLKNSWRTEQSYGFVTPRIPENISDQVQLPLQTQYKTYQPFYFWNGTSWNQSQNWRLLSHSTYADRYGNSIESRDILGNFSSAIYAYNGSLQEAIAYNAANHEIASDGFEDYYNFYPPGNYPYPKPHFRFWHNRNNIDGTFAHTGLYSLKLNHNDSAVYKTLLRKRSGTIPITTTAVPFRVQPFYCNDVFAPTDSVRTYLTSVWVKYTPSFLPNPSPANKTSTLSPAPLTGILKVSLNNTALNLIPVYQSPQIEGWTQYKYELTISGKICDSLKVILKNPYRGAIYFDDFRVEPKDALLKTFVYEPFRNSPVAVLDENNFAIKYQYNAKDELEEAVKETEKGDIYVVYKKKRMFQK